MRLKAGKNKNFTDRTHSPAEHFPIDQAHLNGLKLEMGMIVGQRKYREKKEQGLKDNWRDLPASEKYGKRK